MISNITGLHTVLQDTIDCLAATYFININLPKLRFIIAVMTKPEISVEKNKIQNLVE